MNDTVTFPLADFDKVLDSFVHTLDALRDFVTIVAPDERGDPTREAIAAQRQAILDLQTSAHVDA